MSSSSPDLDCSGLFEHSCLGMIEAGQTGFGAPPVWERIRWETEVGPTRSPISHRDRFQQASGPQVTIRFVGRLRRTRCPEQASGRSEIADSFSHAL